MKTGSHPAIRFQDLPIVEGPLFRFDQVRPRILSDVVERSMQELSPASLDLLLGEALYLEKIRIKREPPNLFTRERLKHDASILSKIQGGLVRPSAESDRRALVESLIGHYADEIGGHFDPRVYRFATRAVPWGFSWLLNAASVRRFLPWGMTESLRSRLTIQGEISSLQKLAKKGTILLVPTHQSNIDSVLVGYVIYLMSLPPFAYGAGLNLFSNPVLNFFMSRLGAYTVDRRKNNLIYKTTLKNYSTRILSEGIHSIFFPGGTRSRSGAIESKLKLGLLGTALDAQIEGIRSGKRNPNVYVVPMTTSYHFVLEASSLIEDYLAEAGKHRYIIMNDESWQLTKVINFFWKLFSSTTAITVRIGRPMDVFGNFVDDDGRSLGPNGTTIDPARWLTSGGELRPEPQRDHEYTRELGERIVERFHRENTVLTSHVVAFVLFETLRKKYRDLDLFRFLRLSIAQRSLPYPEFLAECEECHRRLRAKADRGEVFLAEDLLTSDTEKWVLDGIRQLGQLHEVAVAKAQEGAIWTEDMNLLYYYRNRLSGYGLSLLGQYDAKGFLA